jgi:hypothetical protein
MSAVVEFIEDVGEAVVDAVGDVVDVAVDVVEDVAETVGDVVENALENPVATIATIAAVAAAPATGGASLQWIPAINAANTLAQGGDFEDALTSAAISYVAQGVGQYVGDVAGTAFQYGTDPLSQQTAMLAAQSGDMLGGTLAGTVGGAAGAVAAGGTAAALSGGDIDQAMINALANYAVRTGVRYGVNEAGKIVDQFGNEASQSAVDQINADARSQLDPYEIDNIGNRNVSEILTGAIPVVDPYEVDNVENRTYENILSELQPVVDPYEVDNVENRTQENILSELQPVVDPYEVDNVENRTQENILSEPQPTTYDPYEVDNIGNRTQENILSELQPFVDPYEVDNIGNRSEDQILTGMPPLDPYEVDNIGNRSEDQILVGNDPNNPLLDAAGRYLRNQFIDSLSNQIMGGMGLNRRPGMTRMSGGFRPRTNVGLPSTPSVYDLLASFGYNFGQMPGEMLEDGTEQASTGDIRMWSPGSMEWAPQTKLGGLGFAGKFINEDTETQQPENIRQIIDDIQQRGWMTEEERAALEQQAENLNPEDLSNVDATAGMSPWYNPQYAQGGHIDHRPEFYSEGGASLANRYVRGDGDGTSDSVPAMLASGEFVIPADVVSGLGNGDNDAGAKVLDGFMAEVRSHKRSTNPEDLPPDSKGPLAYLAEAHKKAGKKHGRS